MKQILLMIAVVALVGCGKKSKGDLKADVNSSETFARVKSKDVKSWPELATIVNNRVPELEALAKAYESAKIVLQEKIDDPKSSDAQIERSKLALQDIQDDIKKNITTLNDARILLEQILAKQKQRQGTQGSKRDSKKAADFEADLIERLRPYYSANSSTNLPESLDLLIKGPTPEFYEMFPEQIVKVAIRDAIKKSSGELTKADYNAVITLVFTNYLVGGALLKDEGLKEVAKLRNLEKLNLERHNITDTGLKELTELKQLKELNLRRTKVTYSGVTKLQNALPKCNILSNPK